MLRPVQIFGISVRVVLGDQYDLSSGELLLTFALRGGTYSEDCGDRLVGILESKPCILRTLLLLAVIRLIILAHLPFLLFIMESFGHAIALPHGVLACNTLVLHCNALLKHFMSIIIMCMCV